VGEAVPLMAGALASDFASHGFGNAPTAGQLAADLVSDEKPGWEYHIKKSLYTC